jgi:hypothetical protein
MKKLWMLLALLALVLGLTAPALAADEELTHTGRILFVTNGDVEVAADEQADAVVVVGGDATVAGTVNTLLVVNGTATLTGATLETVAVVDGSADLVAGTVVRGDLLHFNATIDRADGVEVGGTVKDVSGDVAGFAVFMGLAALAVWVGVGIATLIVGLLAAGLAARQIRTATTLIRREPGTTALVGLLALIVPPIVAVIAMATIIGIPTGFGILFVIWPAVTFVGYIVAATWLGEFLLSRRTDAMPAERPYAAATIGLLVAFVIGLIPLATAILSIFGLGAVVLAAMRTLRGGGSRERAMSVQPIPAA